MGENEKVRTREEWLEVLNKPVVTLNFTRRPQSCMRRLGIKTLGDLVALSAADLLSAKNFGQVSLAEVRYRLAQHGLALDGEDLKVS